MKTWFTWGIAAILLAAAISFLTGASTLGKGGGQPVFSFPGKAAAAPVFHLQTACSGPDASGGIKTVTTIHTLPKIPAARPEASARSQPEAPDPSENPIPGAEQKVAYLTFDDGPCVEGDGPAQNTPAILDILAKYHIKATFFLMGAHAKKYPELVLREFNEGHAIGNHTYSHVDPRTTPDDKFRGQVGSTNNVIYRITGVKPTLFRPPYGCPLTPGQHRIGMKICGWDLDTLDWTHSASISKVTAKVAKAAAEGKKCLVILFHDRHADGLEICIHILMDCGYRFDTMDHWRTK